MARPTANGCFIHNKISFSADGKEFAVALQNATAKIFDSSSGNLIRTLEGHHDVVTSVNFSPILGRDQVVTTSPDQTVRVWDLHGGESSVVGKYSGPPINGINSAAYSPDGNTVASVSRDGVIKVWDLTRRTLLRQMKQPQAEYATVQFSADGKKLVSFNLTGQNGAVWIWKASSGQLLSTFKGKEKQYPLAISPDGTRVFFAQNGSASIQGIDNPSGDKIDLPSTPGPPYVITSAAFSNDGKRIAMESTDGVGRVWGLDQNQATLLFELKPQAGGCHASPAFSPDGKLIFTVNDLGNILRWNLPQ